MRAAITTRYVPATNYKGHHIVTRSKCGSAVFAYDDGLDVEANHVRAARLHAKRRGWAGDWFGGENHDGKGYTFVVRSGMLYPDFSLASVECQNRESSNE